MNKHGQDVFKAIEKVFEEFGTPQVETRLQKLGARHVALGVIDADFGTIGQALIASLQTVFQEKFDEGSKQLWVRIYALVEAGMKNDNKFQN